MKKNLSRKIISKYMICPKKREKAISKLNRMLSNYPQRFVQKIRGKLGPIPKPKKWVFVVGCFNSGTTLIHNMISQHPDIGSMPIEGQFYTDQFIIPRDVGHCRLWSAKAELFYATEKTKDIDVVKLRRQWGAKYNDINRPVLIEKTPTNVVRVRWLQKHFKNAYFIGIIRNGYAVSEGIKRKANQPIDKTAKQWAESNRILLKDFKKLKRKIIITYEQFVEYPADTLLEIFNFIGIDQNKIDINDLTNLSFSIHEKNSSIKNMNPRSFENLNDKEIETIQNITGNLLREFDYSRNMEK